MADLQLFGETEIHQFDVAVGVEEEVLGLEVAVNDPTAVQVFKGLDDAGRVEAGRVVVEIAAVAQDRPQLAAQAGLHQHVEVLAILERLVQLDDEIAIGLLHYLLLRHDVLLLAGLHDLILFENKTAGKSKNSNLNQNQMNSF